MSSKAVTWALTRRDLSPGAKLVLIYLCDHYNPVHGCFPSQNTLAKETRLSVSTINVHLKTLQARGLIQRKRMLDPETNKRLSTRYLLAFTDEFSQEPTPESGDGLSKALDAHKANPTPDPGGGSNSAVVQRPTPESVKNHLRNPESKIVIKPVKEDARTHENGFSQFFGKLLRNLNINPDGELPQWWRAPSAHEHVGLWLDDLGLSQGQILKVAIETRKSHPEAPNGPKALDGAMKREATRKPKMPANGKSRQGSDERASFAEQVAFYATWVNSDKHLPPNAINNTMRDALLDMGLATAERLRKRGVA